jgi:hypothetical protein
MCHLQELYAKYKAKGLVILGFDAADDKKIALDMLRDNGATFPNIIDSSDAAITVCFRQYQGPYGSAVPMNYIINREGKVVDAWYGGGREHPKAIAALQKAGGELGETLRQEIAAKSAKAAPEVAAAAQRLFQILRTADYDHNGISTRDWKHRPGKDINYNPGRNDPGWVRWVCRKFKANPITDVRLGKVFAGPDGQPTVHFELRLKDGEILQGDLPFHWESAQRQWIGWEGLDWHLHAPPGKETKKP